MYKVKYGLVPSNVADIFSVKSSKYESLKKYGFSYTQIWGNSLVLHCAPSTAHNIATSKMAAVLPTSAKNKKQGPLLQN